MESSTRQSDRELALAVSDGNEEAFDALRERYYPSVLGFLTALVGDAAAAGAAEATFTAAHEHLRVSPPERFKSWIFAEAHRTGLAVNGRQAGRRRPPGHRGRRRIGRNPRRRPQEGPTR